MEELTFDYNSVSVQHTMFLILKHTDQVTESDQEYRSAVCLCAQRQCRGTYLSYAGSNAYHHTW